MRKYTFLLCTALCMAVTGHIAAQNAPGKAYGKAFKMQSVKTPEDLMQDLKDKSTLPNVVVKGEIAQVCQAEGCWLKMKNKTGEDIMVKFKNHSFFVPKDIAGKTVTVYGTAAKKTVSVQERKHMAEDAGASEGDIQAITQPKDEVRIDATGVVVE